MKYAMSRFFVLILFAWPAILFAQTQSSCAGTVSITDVSRADPAVILVIANSSQANYNITGPSTYHGSGWNFVHQNVPPGTYTITWGAVAGCETPSPETKTTDARGSIAFAGNYKDMSSKKGNGTIFITINIQPRKVSFTITGPEGTQKVEDSTYNWYYAPVGTYTVAFGPVEGFTAPPPQTKTLSDGGVINFSGEATCL